jgi:nucleoside-diphosphate-sugar epimerase
MLLDRAPRIGSPDAVRDMMYITDHINAYNSLISTSISKETFNFGNASMLTMLKLAEKIKEKIGFSGEIQTGFPPDYPNRPIVDPFLSLDASKAKYKLGWEPQTSVEKGLDKAIAFWRERI